MSVDLYGGRGGNLLGSGGLGARVQATFLVTSGVTYQYVIGGKGNDTLGITSNSNPNYNYGGSSGAVVRGSTGGGMSYLLKNVALGNMVVAGGGGGGSNCASPNNGGNGGWYGQAGSVGGIGGGGGGTPTTGGNAGCYNTQCGLASASSYGGTGYGNGGGGGFWGGGGGYCGGGGGSSSVSAD
eukprot:gene36182-44632_t